MLKLLLKKTNAAFPSDTCDGSSDKFDHDYLLAEESHTLNEERVQKKVVLLLACCIWSKLGIWKRFLPVWWKNVWLIFLRILPRLLINFFGISRNFFIFCVLRELLENVINIKKSSWRTKYSSIILRAGRMEKAREVNKGDRGAALDFWRQTDRVICSARFAASLFFFVFAPGIDVALSLLFGS